MRELLTSRVIVEARPGSEKKFCWTERAGDGPRLGSSAGVGLEQEVVEGSLHLSLDLRGFAGGVCIA